MNKTKRSKIGFVLCTALLGALTGCVGYGDQPRSHGGYYEGQPRPREVYVPPPSVQVGAGVVVQDDYVYYPGYQVYYSSNRRQYVYLEGRSWVSRPAPRGVSIDALLASPSVRLDFHDHPSNHHATVVKQYPKKWKPQDGNPNHGRGNDQGDRR